MPPSKRPRVLQLFWLALLILAGATAASATDLYHHIDRATAFESQGKNREAIIEWKNALRYDPNNLDAHLALGRLYIELGDGERAEREIRRASSLGATANRVVSPLATALLVQRSYNQLIVELKPDNERYAPDKISPTNRAKLLIARGHALTALDRLDDAQQSFASALDTGQRQIDARLGLAFIAVRQGDLQQALKICAENLSEAPDNIETLLLQAEVQRRLRHFEAAARHFGRVLRKIPRQRGALVGLSRTRLSQHRYDLADKTLKQFARYYPQDPELQYLRAVLGFRQGRYPDAAALLSDLLNRYPEHLQALLLAATVNYLLGHREQAQIRIDKVLTLTPGNNTARRLKALIAMKQGNSDEVVTLLEPSIDHSPGDPWPAAMSAKAALLSGRSPLGEQALQTFLNAGDARNDKLRAAQQALADNQIKAALSNLNQFLTRPLTQRGAEHIEQALIYLQQGRWDDADMESRRLLDIVPGEAIAHHIAALVNLGKGFPDEAQASLEYAAQLRPDFTPSLIALGRLYLANQEFDKAIQVSAALRHSAPDKPMGFALEGDIHLAQGDRAQAVDTYRKALNKADTRLAITNLSQRLVGLGDTQKVTEKLEDWIDEHPKDLELRIFLALQLQVQKDPDRAMAHYREALKQDPDQLVALNELAVWQQRQGKASEAVGYAEHAYALSPGNPVVADTLGWIRLTQKRRDEAERLLGDAIEKLQGVPIAHYHYGVLMATTGHPEQARKALERALADDKPSYWTADARQALRKLPKQTTADADSATNSSTTESSP